VHSNAAKACEIGNPSIDREARRPAILQSAAGIAEESERLNRPPSNPNGADAVNQHSVERGFTDD
jgi:hypothetical protein